MSAPVLIPKNDRGECYRVAEETFIGRRYFDVRLYFRNEQGELKPTQKGVTISPECLPKVAAALLTLAAEQAQ